MSKKILRDLYYRTWKLPQVKHWHQQRIKKIQQRGDANVVFLCINLAMWRYEGVLRLMMADHRFHCQVIFGTFNNFQEEDTINNYHTLSKHFAKLGVCLINSTTSEGMDEAMQYMHQADIIFYPQPYGDLFCNSLDNKYYRDRLLCYVPYAFFTASAEDWTCNTALHNQAWRLYRESEYHLREAKQNSHCRGENVVIVGNTKSDEFAEAENSPTVWKKQSKNKKKLIWAPHFSIEQGTAMSRNGFLWLHDIMPKLAEIYSDKLQVTFKPHPKLFTTLCKMEDWGTSRAKAYYEMWNTMDNGQCELGDYVPLFMQSDAIIHDCGSFIFDYLHTGKPCMFVSSDINDTRIRLNEYALKALNQYYIGSTPDDVIQFIENVVLSDKDPLKKQRLAFKETILPKEREHSVAETIYNDIVHSIFFS